MATEKETDPKNEGPRSFTTFLRTLSNGEAESMLSYNLHELGKALAEQALARNGKVKGELVFKLNFAADMSGAVGIGYSIKMTPPAPVTTPAMFFLTSGGNLAVENQRQQKLPLREVDAPRGDVREAAYVGGHKGAKDVS